MKADLLLVTVTEVETASVFEVFRDATGQKAKLITISDKVFHNLGTVNGTSVYLIQSEMGAGGLGAAQQTVQKGIEGMSPSAVIMLGIAFGVNDKKQKIGDILVSRQLVPYDFQRVGIKARGKQKERSFLLRDDRPHCSPWLFDSFRGAAHYWKGQAVHVGQVLTGEKLIDNLDYCEELIELAPEAIGGEMEGRGLYVACQDKKVDWILVKAISDWANGNKGRNKKARQQLAATNAAKFVLHVIQTVGIQRTKNRKRVDLLLEGEFDELTPTRQADLINILATILHTEQNEIRVLSIQRGSIRIELEMPEAAANYLYLLFDQNQINLGNFQPLALSVEGFETTILVRSGTKVSPENANAPAPSRPLMQFLQHHEGENRYRVDISIKEDDGSHQSTPVNFEFVFNETDRSDLRWYLEDYLQYPLDPAPRIAERIEKRMKELGIELFNSIFRNTQASRLWAKIEDRLDDTRVEIITDVNGAVDLPWELLCDPKTDSNIALRANSFVRAHYSASRKAERAQTTDKVRILLVICRPGGREDVPFRSVASRLLKGLSDEARERFELVVLRPPTFEQLGKTLRDAKAQGKPYHIIHFDGHGVYLESTKDALGNILKKLGMLVFGGPREGTHGYLLFENPKAEQNGELIDGPSLGNLLVDNDVPALILNACRSAHADIQEKPVETEDVNAQVRAFGSLAQEVMDAGVGGVVAMRYNVYVVTAAQFVANLYASLAQGQPLGEAVSMGRKQLAAQPLREIAFDPIPLQDWSVPVAYEAAPIQLFSRSEFAPPIKIDLSKKIRAEDNLPRPDVGFFGRDETILALDRAFDTQPVVLLHAYAGSGKTMTAAEFARWYRQTGGLQGPILFTSFEQYKPLTQVLSAVEETYSSLLEANNIQWLALDDEARLNLTLQIFRQIPPLWIWDNVEPIHGFPAGTTSAWSEKEQRELKMFLQIVTAQSKTKFLLTSRRDEREWLGDIPMSVSLPPMPMQERVRLTRALADKQGKRIADVKDWLLLLRFTQGNPLTITVIAGQALRDGISSKGQIEAYLNKLHNGKAAFDDEASEGRSKSLGASLSYGFKQAFNEDERKVLALLHFFQGFVDVDALRIMVNPKNGDWGLGMKGFTNETGIAILDKAADIGLLTSHGGGYYTIHPALPWFFRSLFEQYYPNDLPSPLGEGAGVRSAHAFVESMGELGDYYMQQYEYGNRDVIAPLRAEEPNLLHARSLARQHEWWDALTRAIQGLYTLYGHTGRHAEWKRLVDELVPDFVGVDDLPLSGREEQWSILTQHRVLLARKSRDWPEAERLQRVCVEWDRRNAASVLARPADALSTGEKNVLRNLGASLHDLGQIQREMSQPDCVKSYQETFEIMQRIGDVSAAVPALNLGNAYMQLPALRNLDEAERWYHRSLKLQAEGDKQGKAKCYSQLGLVEYEKFKEAKNAKQPDEQLLECLNAAVKWYHLALENDSPDNPEDLAIDHNQLGNIYDDAGDVARALEHYNKSVQYKEAAGNIYAAGATRFNIALTLAQNKRLSDALLYARAALRNFESYEGRAKQDEDAAKRLIAGIEEAMKG